MRGRVECIWGGGEKRPVRVCGNEYDCVYLEAVRLIHNSMDLLEDTLYAVHMGGGNVDGSRAAHDNSKRQRMVQSKTENIRI